MAKFLTLLQCITFVSEPSLEFIWIDLAKHDLDRTRTFALQYWIRKVDNRTETKVNLHVCCSMTLLQKAPD